MVLLFAFWKCMSFSTSIMGGQKTHIPLFQHEQKAVLPCFKHVMDLRLQVQLPVSILMRNIFACEPKENQLQWSCSRCFVHDGALISTPWWSQSAITWRGNRHWDKSQPREKNCGQFSRMLGTTEHLENTVCMWTEDWCKRGLLHAAWSWSINKIYPWHCFWNYPHLHSIVCLLMYEICLG